MLADKLPVAGDDAAEILGPGPIDSAVDDYVPDLFRPKFLRKRREAHQRIDLVLGEKPHASAHGTGSPS